MRAIDIPDPLPSAITPPRTVIEFLINEHLEEFGDTSLVARTWHWVLHGGELGPVSRMDWSQFDGDGPPSAATLAAESTASEPPLCPHRVGRTQQGQVYLLAVHLRTRRRSAAAVPPLGRRAHTYPPRTGQSTVPCARSPTAERPAGIVAAKAFRCTANLKGGTRLRDSSVPR